jgi:hypothetical protein
MTAAFCIVPIARNLALSHVLQTRRTRLYFNPAIRVKRLGANRFNALLAVELAGSFRGRIETDPLRGIAL